MGEQAVYLRFMPVQRPANRWRWWAGVLGGGPGWVVLGVIKMLGNAIKFTLCGRVSFRARYAREMACIEIEDTGPGLSVLEHERIFELFTRADTPGVAAPGAGLGLTIAKMLTDLMGGELTVSSTPGVGSIFCVRLFLPEVRVAVGTGPAAMQASASQLPQGYAGARLLILVVDNQEADRELLVRLLQPLGFALRTADGGHDCLDLLAAGLRPDAIFMDLAMPGIDGWQTIRRLRALSGHDQTPIAIVSANAFDKGLAHEGVVCAEDFLLKPVRHSELLD